MTTSPTPPTRSACPECSTAPWTTDYSPYSRSSAWNDTRYTIGDLIPAYEIFDAGGNKIFDTNEDAPQALQEANATLAAAAPQLLEAVRRCILFLADYDESDGEEGDVYRLCLAADQIATKGWSNIDSAVDRCR